MTSLIATVDAFGPSVDERRGRTGGDPPMTPALTELQRLLNREATRVEATRTTSSLTSALRKIQRLPMRSASCDRSSRPAPLVRPESSPQPSLPARTERAANPTTPASQPAAATSGRDRRAFPRRPSECGVAVFRLSERGHVGAQHDWLLHGTKVRGELLDVSMNGVAFLIGRPVERGETLLLRLHNRRTNYVADCRADVLRALPTDDKRWKVVCRFARHLTFEQVCALGRQLFETAVV